MRWRHECLMSLHKRHTLIYGKERHIKFIIKGDEENRALWKIRIVEKFLLVEDGAVRAVQFRAEKLHLER